MGRKADFLQRQMYAVRIIRKSVAFSHASTMIKERSSFISTDTTAKSLHAPDDVTPDSTFGAHNSASVLQHQQQSPKVVVYRTKSNFG